MRTGEKQPTKEQEAFLQHVVSRCETEHAEFTEWNKPGGQKKVRLSEPARICLLGDPGAGKSYCITQLKDFFETCVGFEHGIHFQFLATQNSMAELIGGTTVHTWGAIPANKAAASAKHANKEVDWDQLFENCLSMRWLVIDECSTLSPGLLAMLDSFLRTKACQRHPYAYRKRSKRMDPRPFGGLNIIFAGDLWQLPPVKEIALFAYPLRKADGSRYEAGEQRILAMFWDWQKKSNKDGIQKLYCPFLK